MVLTLDGKGRVVERRGSKYGNKKTLYRGRQYHSIAEANYARFLDSELSAGRVSAWEPQHRIALFANGVDICDYVADFRVTHADGRIEYVEVKGYATEVYKLKKKMLEALRGIRLKEIPAAELQFSR